MKNLLKRLKVGQKVWSMNYGKGTVSGINSGDPEFPIRVRFQLSRNHARHETYDEHGKVFSYQRTPDLYIKKPVIIQKSRIQSIAAEAYGQGLIDGGDLERMLPAPKTYNSCSDTLPKLNFEKCSFNPPSNFK